MPNDKPFYDDERIQEIYFAHRKRPDNPNDALERPLFLELAGDLVGLDIIDLGCGDASFGKEALDQGARSYEGIEVSAAMLERARENLAHTSGQLRHEPIENWRANDAEADFVTSRLALHYIETLESVFQEIYKALRPGGRLVISVEHPVITSSYESLAQGKRTSWIVDDYFKPGARVHTWLGQEVIKYHRTLEDYFDLVAGAGLRLEHMRESRPQKKNFYSEEEFERRLRIPLFLFITARKPA